MTREPSTPPVIPDYELLKPIGRGSYGEVWLARSVTGVFRVIKIVRRDRFDDERPFLRELEGISRYQAAVSGRPRQLALLHVGRNDAAGYFYYVMEPADDAEAGSSIDPARYVPLTLKELFARRGRLPAMEAVQFALELARGLAVLHGENLIHRDIKPSNIIFVQRVPKLADVGLVTANEGSMTFVGTPGYVPPEGPGSVVADIYSLGKVLYETATGLDRNEFPRLPSDLTEGTEAGLFREINAIVLKACHPNPTERHQTAEAFVRDLELVQAGKSVAFYEDIRRQFRAVAIGAAIVAVAAASVTAMMYWRSGILEAANEQTRHALYRSDLAVAQLAKASGDLGRARAALQRQVPKPGDTDLRGLEWAILARDVRGEGAPLQPLTNGVAIRRIEIDPTGRWVAASFIDDRVGIWDLRNGRVVRVLDNAKVLGGFTPDGLLVVDEPIRALRFENPTNGVVRRVETGKRLLQLLPGQRSFVVSPSGDLVLQLLGGFGTKIETQFNVTKECDGLGISAQGSFPDGSSAALGLFRETGARRERWLASIDMIKGQERWRQTVDARILWIRCSPDNRHFVANIGGLSPTVYRIDQRSAGMVLLGHTARVQDACFSKDGAWLATASADQTVRVWDVRTGRIVSVHHGLGRPASAIAFSYDSTIMAAGDDSGGIRIFPFPPRMAPSVLPGFFADVHGDVVLSADGKTLAVTATTNSISLVHTDDLGVRSVITNQFQPIAFSDDGRKLWSFRSDWSMSCTVIESGQDLFNGRLLPKDFSVLNWAVNPQQDSVAISGTLGQVSVLNLRTASGVHSTEPNSNLVWALAFSHDSREIWTGNDAGVIRRRNSESGEIIGHVTEIQGEVQALALSSDEKWAAAAVFDDASVRIWDRLRLKWRTALLTHRRFVQALSFTADSTRLISAGTDGRIVVWRVPEFEEIAAFEAAQGPRPRGDEGIATMRLAPNGSILAALMEDGRLQVWRAN